jgi:hypothetical protein
MAWMGRLGEVDATVVGRAWERTIRVERYHATPHEGFQEDIPEGAVHVRSLGPRHHHDERIRDGFDVEHYTEQVRAGFKNERYPVEVECGDVCTPGPDGEPSCTPRRCVEQRTRRVPRFREVKRTRRVPRYRFEPRDAEYFAYEVWTWTPDRAVASSGEDAEAPRWPSEEEVHLGRGLGEGEREREIRVETYEVTFRDEDGATHPYVCQSEGEFRTLTMGSEHRIRRRADRSFTPVREGE